VRIRILAVILALAALGAAAVLGTRYKPAAKPVLVFHSVRGFPKQYVGIVSYNVYEFDQGCECEPNVAAHYIHVGAKTSMNAARSVLAVGAVPMLELEPYGINLGQIAAGHENRWLTAYARAVAALHAPVIMSFAPEANGTWYSWGYPHASPAAFVGAWRDVVSAFRAAGATRVRWAWIMNVNFVGSENIANLWPGNAWVNILGLDGYFTDRGTFQTLFGPTIVSMRSLSSDPLLVTETAAAPSVGKLPMLRQIINGVAQYGLAGFVWFDVRQSGGVTRQNWQLEADPPALTLFGKRVNQVTSGP
jgi:Glycosyl hydrolase family 26